MDESQSRFIIRGGDLEATRFLIRYYNAINPALTRLFQAISRGSNLHAILKLYEGSYIKPGRQAFGSNIGTTAQREREVYGELSDEAANAADIIDDALQGDTLARLFLKREDGGFGDLVYDPRTRTIPVDRRWLEGISRTLRFGLASGNLTLGKYAEVNRAVKMLLNTNFRAIGLGGKNATEFARLFSVIGRIYNQARGQNIKTRTDNWDNINTMLSEVSMANFINLSHAAEETERLFVGEGKHTAEVFIEDTLENRVFSTKLLVLSWYLGVRRGALNDDKLQEELLHLSASSERARPGMLERKLKKKGQYHIYIGSGKDAPSIYYYPTTEYRKLATAASALPPLSDEEIDQMEAFHRQHPEAFHGITLGGTPYTEDEEVGSDMHFFA